MTAEKKEPKEPKELEVTLSYLCWSRPRYGLILIPPEMRHAGKAHRGHSVLDTVCHVMAAKEIGYAFPSQESHKHKMISSL